MAHKCLLAMLKPDLVDKVVKAAKAAGATGATIIPASGTGAREAKTFFGLTLEVRTDIVLIILEETLVGPVMAAVRSAGRLSEPGTGIAFVLSVDQAAGLESQTERNR